MSIRTWYDHTIGGYTSLDHSATPMLAEKSRKVKKILLSRTPPIPTVEGCSCGFQVLLFHAIREVGSIQPLALSLEAQGAFLAARKQVTCHLLSVSLACASTEPSLGQCNPIGAQRALCRAWEKHCAIQFSWVVGLLPTPFTTKAKSLSPHF